MVLRVITMQYSTRKNRERKGADMRYYIARKAVGVLFTWNTRKVLRQVSGTWVGREGRWDVKDAWVADVVTLKSIQWDQQQLCGKVTGHFGSYLEETRGTWNFSPCPNRKFHSVRRSDIISLTVTCSRPQTLLRTVAGVFEKLQKCCLHVIRGRYNARFQVLGWEGKGAETVLMGGCKTLWQFSA